MRVIRSGSPGKYRNDFRAIQAFAELRDLSDISVPMLVQILEEHPSTETRVWAAAALGQIGPYAAQAVPAFRKAAEDKNPRVRQSAEHALVNIQREPRLLKIIDTR